MRRNLRFIAYRVLSRDWQRVEYAISSAVSRYHLSLQDAALLGQIVRGVLKNRLLLDYYASRLYTGNYQKAKKSLKILLHIGLYQLHFLRIPSYAAVSETVEAARQARMEGIVPLLNAVLRAFDRQKEQLKLPENLPEVKRLSLEYSHPEWLIEHWIERFGKKQTLALLKWNNSTPRIYFRQNLLKIDWEVLKIRLQDEGYEVQVYDTGEPAFFSVNDTGRLLRSSYFQEGYLSVQDPGSAQVIKLLSPSPGSTVIDVCAAPGGKATYIAQIAVNGAVLAYDVNPFRVKMIESEKERLQLSNLVTSVGDGTRVRFPQADFVLCDVPCTGTGVMDRRADLRWRKKMEDLKKLPDLQFRILNNASRAVKPDGVLVYATCSLEEEENWHVVEKFLNRNPEFYIEPAYRYVDEKFVDKMGGLFIFPPEYQIDGAFAVRMRRSKT